MSAYFPPRYGSTAFHCPCCDVKANQQWGTAHGYFTDSVKEIKISQVYVEVSFCSHCFQPALWLSEKIIYPSAQVFPSPNKDLSNEVKEVYNEAAAIAEKSPRAACALLRLAMETLLKQLGGAGNLNEVIRKLVEKGLDSKMQQSLDIVRVTGNKAIHPGKIDFSETSDVRVLFDLINLRTL